MARFHIIRRFLSRIALMVLVFSLILTGTACGKRISKKDVNKEVQEILNKDYARGRYKKCIVKYKKLLDGINKDDIQNTKDIVLVECNLAICYMLVGDYDEAEQNLKDAKQKSDQIHLDVFPVDSVYYTYGQLEAKRENYDQAVSYFQEALKWRKSIYGEDAPETGTLYIELANAYLQLHELDNAEKNAQMALDLENKGKLKYGILTNAYIALGDVRMEQKNYGDAEQMYKKASECYVDGGQEYGKSMLSLIENRRAMAVDKEAGQGN